MSTASSVQTAPATAPAVSLQGVTKRFDQVTAVQSLTLTVQPGELYGVIGPDGAGKTTLFRTVVTLLAPDEGTTTVLGLDTVRDYRALRNRLGYMPGRFALYPDLSVRENLSFYATVFGTTVADGMRIIEPIWRQLSEFSDRRAGALSGGMKQKLALCCALVHAPDLLVLDEPTTGVDAVSRVEFWELLGRLRDGGLTIMVSTPYMDEAARCDRVALMQGGRVLRVDTPAALAQSYPLPLFALRSGGERLHLLRTLREFPHAASVWPFGEDLHYTDRRAGLSPSVVLSEASAWLAQHGFSDVQMRPIVASVEDVFMQLATAVPQAA